MNDHTQEDHIVTQEEIQTLAELEEISREAKSLRDSIRKRLIDGAKLEPGPCSVSIDTHARIQISVDTISQLLGPLSSHVLRGLPVLTIHRMDLKSGTHTKHRQEPAAVLPKEARERKYDPPEEFDLTKFVLDAVPLILKPDTEEVAPQQSGDNLLDDEIEAMLEGDQDLVVSKAETIQRVRHFTSSDLPPLCKFAGTKSSLG
jgi:hypothetical protein